MSEELTLDLPKFKKKNGSNGKRHGGRPDEHDLAGDLKGWLADLNAAESLRKEQLRQIGELRSGIYRLAKAKGVSPAMLRATRKLVK
jgi:hypothetical protein